MNKDNSNKSQAGSFSNSSLEELLNYLKNKELIVDYRTQKFGYEGKRKQQFKCDYLVQFSNGEEWILFSAASLTSDRLKTKQWDAENIKKINNSISKAYVVCPDSTKSMTNILRYRDYIRMEQDYSFVDDILLHSEFLKEIEDYSLGAVLSGSKASKKGFNFEDLIATILKNDQNYQRWRGNELAAGFNYPIFEMIVNKLNLDPSAVLSLEASSDVPGLPQYIYKDGSSKPGGRAKTDVILKVFFNDGSSHAYTFSCKNTSKSDVTVFQFPPKYCVAVLGISELDTESLLVDYVQAGGTTKMSPDKVALLTERLSPYLNKFNRWVLQGIEGDGSTLLQRPNYIITRYQKKCGDEVHIETIEECIEAQYEKRKTHFGTAFCWTVTSKSKKGECFPAMTIKF